jgi:hypothetical protein
MRSYGAARGLFSFISVAAWLFIIGGAIGAVVGSAILQDMAHSNRDVAGLVGTIPGILVSIMGFFTLAMAQMGRAGVDSAEYGQQMLQVARDHLDVSRQSLRKGDQPPTTYTAQKPVDDTSKSGGYATLSDRKALSVPAAEDARISLTYKGRTIISDHGNYQLDGRSYPSLEAVHAHIDGLVSLPGIGQMGERAT